MRGEIISQTESTFVFQKKAMKETADNSMKSTSVNIYLLLQLFIQLLCILLP